MEVDRLNHVQIWLTSLEEPMVVSWETREQILGRLTPIQAAVGDAFETSARAAPSCSRSPRSSSF